MAHRPHVLKAVRQLHVSVARARQHQLQDTHDTLGCWWVCCQRVQAENGKAAPDLAAIGRKTLIELLPAMVEAQISPHVTVMGARLDRSTEMSVEAMKNSLQALRYGRARTRRSGSTACN